MFLMQWPETTIRNRLMIALAVGIVGLLAVWAFDQSRAGDGERSDQAVFALGPPTPQPMTSADGHGRRDEVTKIPCGYSQPRRGR